ncbi:MAG: deoxyguanosinetriphosphate triphosphohydrolase, partial [Pseudomonadota bacterium]
MRWSSARLHRDPSVLAAREKAGRVVEELFAVFAADPDLLPPQWRGADGQTTTARHLR